MISLELAKKLKDAGLKWVPEDGDCLHVDEDIIHVIEANTDRYFDCPDVWLPSLSQLLAEIEARDENWNMGNPGPLDNNKYWFQVRTKMRFYVFYADTPEEAAGLALLWILEQGVIDGE